MGSSDLDCGFQRTRLWLTLSELAVEELNLLDPISHKGHVGILVCVA